MKEETGEIIGSIVIMIIILAILIIPIWIYCINQKLNTLDTKLTEIKEQYEPMIEAAQAVNRAERKKLDDAIISVASGAGLYKPAIKQIELDMCGNECHGGG